MLSGYLNERFGNSKTIGKVGSGQFDFFGSWHNGARGLYLQTPNWTGQKFKLLKGGSYWPMTKAKK